MGRPVEQAHRSTSNHTKAKRPEIDVNSPGRLRVANIMALLGISHSTFYARLAAGALPKPDGRDGTMPYWYTSTIRPLLGDQPAGGSVSKAAH